MIGILITKFQWLLRNPWTLIIMTFMSILFAFIIGGNSFNEVKVPTYIEGGSNTGNIMEHFKEDHVFELDEVSKKEELVRKVENGKSEFGLVLRDDDFNIIVAIDSPNVHLLEQKVQNAYVKNEQWGNLEKAVGKEIEEQSVFQIKSASFTTDDEHIYDRRLHTLFGFTLFFVIYTIAFSVFQILLEKRSGVWDRMILSPVRKWEMYAGNFLYSFLVGYFQVFIIFCIFRYIVKVDFNGTFLQTLLILIPYVLAIVALSTFLIGIVKSTQQFNAITPIVAVSMAMIGGAYWPLEIVESKVMLMLSKFVPIKYAMDALQGITIYGQTIGEVLYPIIILLLMSVVLTGLGIHLMEKRFVS